MYDQCYWVKIWMQFFKGKMLKNTVIGKSVISGLLIVQSHSHWPVVVGMFPLYQVIPDRSLVFWAHFFIITNEILSTTLKRSFSSSWLLKESLRIDLLTVSSITCSNCSLKIALILSITFLISKLRLWWFWSWYKSRTASRFPPLKCICHRPFYRVNFRLSFYIKFLLFYLQLSLEYWLTLAHIPIISKSLNLPFIFNCFIYLLYSIL